MTDPSWDSRESITLFSGSWQKGQRISRSLPARSQTRGVEGKLLGHLPHFSTGPGKEDIVAGAVQNAADHPSDLLHFSLAHSAGGDRRRPDADARGDGGLFRIEGDDVLVDGDPRF